ncbi:hypothetical protein ES703_109728 [subsurface metagenome]
MNTANNKAYWEVNMQNAAEVLAYGTGVEAE